MKNSHNRIYNITGVGNLVSSPKFISNNIANPIIACKITNHHIRTIKSITQTTSQIKLKKKILHKISLQKHKTTNLNLKNNYSLWSSKKNSSNKHSKPPTTLKKPYKQLSLSLNRRTN